MYARKPTPKQRKIAKITRQIQDSSPVNLASPPQIPPNQRSDLDRRNRLS